MRSDPSLLDAYRPVYSCHDPYRYKCTALWGSRQFANNGERWTEYVGGTYEVRSRVHPSMPLGVSALGGEVQHHPPTRLRRREKI